MKPLVGPVMLRWLLEGHLAADLELFPEGRLAFLPCVSCFGSNQWLDNHLEIGTSSWHSPGMLLQQVFFSPGYPVSP